MSDSIGTRLADARKQLNLTQGEFSETTGVPLSTLKKYEGSHSEPGAEALSMIAKARINLHWLVTGKGEPLIKEADAGGKHGTQMPVEINVEALAAIMAAVEFANPKASPPERAAVAAHAYATSIREGLITSTGPGQRAPKNAA
jgi:transcriptional regulator with XRE-family HTH domain